MTGNTRVLFVEDNDISRELIRRIFKRINHITADVARDGDQALHLFMTNEYDIVFMDIQMPVMNGFEVTHKMRVLDREKNRHTPIIAVTAFVGVEDQLNCSEAGMDGYIPKPINTQDLLDKINEHVAGIETLQKP